MFEQLSDKLSATFKRLSGKGRLSEANIADAMRQVRIALLEADVALEVTRDFVGRVKARAEGKEVLSSLTPGQAVIKVVQDELVALMGTANDGLRLTTKPPAVILVAGLQGAGKTTTVGKLAHLLNTRDNKTVLVASVDVYRPAAIKQLESIAASVGVDFFAGNADQSPLEIAVDAIQQARQTSRDVVLIDTAGRSHVEAMLMQEIQQLQAAIKPIETLFVADSMTGQDAVNSARAFDQALPLTGIILTKTDGDARGGAALSIRQITGKPIKFLGVGEAMDALQPFHPERVASRILGMGDVLSLVEQAERKVDRNKAEKLATKLAKGKQFNLDDFRQQMQQMQNMGGITSMLDKLPGSDNIPQRALHKVDDKQTAQTIAIINSMTPHERHFPAVLRGARKKRIALGAGTQVQNVNRLLKQFMQMQKMMQRMHKKGGMRGLMQQLQGPGGGLPGSPF